MTSTIPLAAEKSEVLRQDTRGRVRTPAARREALLDEFERGGSSAAQFARLSGVKYATFANWVQRRRRERQASAGAPAETLAAAPSRSAPVRLWEALAAVPDRQGGEGLCLELPGGVRLAVETPRQLPLVAELLRLLAAGGLRPC